MMGSFSQWARLAVATATRIGIPFVLLALPYPGKVRGVWAADQPPASAYVDARGIAHLPPLTVPPSSFMSPQARAGFLNLFAGEAHSPPINGNIQTIRASYDRHFAVLVAREKELFPVKITHEMMNGVRTEVVVPAGGVAAKRRYRVLINLHGGGFMMGEGIGGEVESIPFASVGKIKVVTVAYREGPEYKFPAASEGVAAVYRALLRSYPPRNIGIYGCSAGGILTAESMAWFEKVKLPTPGAIGTFCGSTSPLSGDSWYTAFALTDQHPLPGEIGGLAFSSYFRGVSLPNPLVFPSESRRILSKFPPTLLIGGSRDLQ